jgi:methylglutamate dehydrogenase subunit D
MAERVSALAHLPPAGTAGARVALSESRPAAILQIAAWPEADTRVQAAIAAQLGVLVPRAGNGVVERGFTVIATSPGRFLVAGNADDLLRRIEGAIPSTDGAVTDLSHGRAILRLEGEAAKALLQKCVAIDLDAASFPPGRAAQSMIHHIDVVIHRLGAGAFEVWALRSFIEALAEWLLEAGEDLGARYRPVS